MARVRQVVQVGLRIGTGCSVYMCAVSARAQHVQVGAVWRGCGKCCKCGLHIGKGSSVYMCAVNARAKYGQVGAAASYLCVLIPRSSFGFGLDMCVA